MAVERLATPGVALLGALLATLGALLATLGAAACLLELLLGVECLVVVVAAAPEEPLCEPEAARCEPEAAWRELEELLCELEDVLCALEEVLWGALEEVDGAGLVAAPVAGEAGASVARWICWSLRSVAAAAPCAFCTARDRPATPGAFGPELVPACDVAAAWLDEEAPLEAPGLEGLETCPEEPGELLFEACPWINSSQAAASRATATRPIWYGRESCAIPSSFGTCGAEVECRYIAWTVRTATVRGG